MNQSNFTIYLASRSPRRIELLKQLGLDCQVLPSDIDESALFNEHPAAYVQRLAQQKAEACFKTLMQQKLAVLPISEKNLTVFSGHILNSNDLVKPKQLVIAADTTVAINREILGKPIDDHDARAMLRLLSGSQHQVHTAVAIGTAEKLELMLSTTTVEMMPLSDAQIEVYINTGEHQDKAGSYGIQGYAGAWIKCIEGSYTGVMGLPIYETALLLRQFGVTTL